MCVCVCVVPVVEGAAAAVVGVDVCVCEESFFMPVSPNTKGPTKEAECMQEIPTLRTVEEGVCVCVCVCELSPLSPGVCELLTGEAAVGGVESVWGGERKEGERGRGRRRRKRRRRRHHHHHEHLLGRLLVVVEDKGGGARRGGGRRGAMYVCARVYLPVAAGAPTKLSVQCLFDRL